MNWDAFFTFYTRECKKASLDEGKVFCARDHNALLRIADILKTEPTRECARQKIRERFMRSRSTDEKENMAEGSMRLLARIIAMVNVGALSYEIATQRSVSWSDKQSLPEAIHDYFKVVTGPDTKKILFSTSFTAREICRIAGIGIRWTDNLVNHLRLVEGDSKVCVFQHVSFLRHMKDIRR
jgi:hypothetical protein